MIVILFGGAFVYFKDFRAFFTGEIRRLWKIYQIDKKPTCAWDLLLYFLLGAFHYILLCNLKMIINTVLHSYVIILSLYGRNKRILGASRFKTPFNDYIH